MNAIAQQKTKRNKVRRVHPVASSPAPSVRMILLSDIDRDDRNHRVESAADAEKTKSLAESMNRNGQQQPVRVFDYGEDKIPKGKCRYLLVFGFRRCAAAELNGWSEIAAIVTPAPLLPDGSVDQMTLQTLRGIENLQRENLNPVEECILIQQLAANLAPRLDDAGTLSRDEDHRLTDDGIRHLAYSIGRTEAWVRDRLYLDRLSPPVKQKVMEGKLFLIFAREIAKLADHQLQERVSSLCEADPKDGHCSTTIGQVRRYVAERQNTLRSVPWHLDKPFPKNKLIVGACNGCPFNSSNDKKLFEHDESAAPESFCLKPSCFDAKREVTDKAVETAVTKIAKQQLSPTESSAVSVAADFVKPGRVARQAKKQAEGVKPKESDKRVDPWDTPEHRARRAFGEAQQKWRQQANRAMTADLKRHPRRLTAILLLAKSRRIGCGMEERDLAKARDLLKLAAAATPQSIAQLEKRVVSQTQFGLDDVLSVHGKEMLIRELAGLCGIELSPFPKLEEFLPNEGKEIANAESEIQLDPPES